MSMAMSVDEAQARDGIRVREEGLTESERNYAVAIHVTPFAGLLFGPAVLVPLILWLVRKDDSAFNDDHGREVVNVLITGAIFTFVGGVLALAIIPIIALVIWYVVIAVNLVRGALAASRGEYFRYPMTLRILS